MMKKKDLFNLTNRVPFDDRVNHQAEADWVYNYPYAAVEEALANAVYHRAYDIREPIEVRVEKEMIEIVSFPGPDRSVTQEGTFNRRQKYRIWQDS